MPDVPSTAPASLGKLIDSMWALRERKRAHEKMITALEGQIEAVQAQILARLDEQEIDSGRGRKATAAVSEAICYAISDFERFAKYVRRNNYFHLFQRRVTDVAVRELFQQNKVVPGLTPFKRRTIHLRSLQ